MSNISYFPVPKSSMYQFKNDPIGNDPFWLYGLSMGIKIGSFKSVIMGVSVNPPTGSLVNS